jgi:hypothetical protein
MKLKRKFNDELSKLTESEDKRKHRQRIIAKGAAEISQTIEQIAEEVSDPGSQKPDRRHVEENIQHLLQDIFDQLEVNGWSVDSMLDSGYVSESLGSEIKRKIQGKLTGKQHAKSLGTVGMKRVVDGLSEKKLTDMFGDPRNFEVTWDEEVLDYLTDLRKDTLELLKAIKKIED